MPPRPCDDSSRLEGRGVVLNALLKQYDGIALSKMRSREPCIILPPPTAIKLSIPYMNDPPTRETHSP